MKKLIMTGSAAISLAAAAQWCEDKSAMSKEYWDIWSPEVIAKLDADIDKYRKADFVGEIGAPAGAEVKVEQISHAFFFGAHIFNYNQLGKKEWNNRYKELYGTLFNSATVAFYWKTLEPYHGQLRFQETYRDTEEFWNNCAHPQEQPYWRRPATDPVINFLRSRDIRIHGHTLCWGSKAWHVPSWIWDEFCPQEEKEALEAASGEKILGHDWRLPMGVKEFDRDEGNLDTSWRVQWKRIFAKLSEEEVAKLCPKAAYFAMDDLINNEWKTRTTVKTDDNGKLSFRGFRGRYRLTWKDANGNEITKLIQLK